MSVFRKRLDPTVTEQDDPVARSLGEEIEAHLEMRTDGLIARGMSPDDARAEALRRFGDPDAARRRLLSGARRTRCRRRVRGALAAVATDVRLAVRYLARAPGYAATAIGIFAGGVALTTSMFTVVDHVLLRPLPYPQPDELVALWSVPEEGSDFAWVSMANWVDWKEASSLESTGLYERETVSVATSEDAVHAPAVRAGGPFFATVGGTFLIGRPFTEDEAQAEAPVVVVSEGFWRRVLGADADLGGRFLEVDGRSVEVIGVVPRRTGFPAGVELWLPYRYRPQSGAMRNNINFEVVARLADGVTIDQAKDELDAIALGIRTTDPAAVYSWGVGVHPLREVVVRDARTQLELLSAAVAFLLLLVCANLAGLGLARGRRRAHETAVHLALGSGRRRVFGRIFAEHLVLAVCGGGTGVALAWLSTGVLLDRAAAVVPRAQEVGFDLRIAVFGVATATAAGLLAGLVPAIRGSRGGLSTVLSGSRGDIGGGRGLPGAVMVGAEVALAVTLLVAGGLLFRSFHTLVTRDLGFDPVAVATGDISLVSPIYTDAEARLSYWERVRDRVAALPGVTDVAISNAVPTSDGGRGFIDLPNRVGENIGADYRVVSEGYFKALGVPLLAGRAFDAAIDGPGTERVTVVSQSMAERFWSGGNPLGQRVRARSMESYVFGGGEAPWLTVVGIVGDVRQYGFDSGVTEDMYVLHRQIPYYSREMSLVVKARAGPAGSDDAIRAAVRQIDPAVAVDVRSMEARLAELMEERRLVLTGLGLFGAASLLLVCLGIYALMSFAADARTREMAVRVALGARLEQVARLMLGSALRVAFAGTAVGLVIAYAFSRSLSALLVDVDPADPSTYVAAAALLWLVATGAALAPSVRAARGDPLDGLRG